jgi:pimeloyl-ACP methyl ester carboxylesterase
MRTGPASATAAVATAGDPAVAALTEIVPGGVRRGSVRRGERVLRWLQAGDGGPIVVLAAGARDTSLTWVPVLPALAARLTVVAYDRAGLGASDPDSSLPTAARQLADLTAVIDTAAGGRCVLVGHSWGGMLAQLLASRSPERVAGLVLVDPAQLGMLDGIPPLLRRSYGYLAERVPSLLLDLGLLQPMARRQAQRTSATITASPRLQALLADAAAAAAGRAQIAAARAESRGIRASRSLPGEAAAVTLPAVPTAVLSATRGFPPQVRRHWTELQASLAAAAGARHIVVPGAGHGVHQDRPELVARVILEVAAEVSS